ncbi:MFS family permease [Bacillus pakistanensis]|uniref:MFS family permease n=1 Tax=Rossellomorea pakistanensis TaxID=992288 RepID=A0ABS2N771_9BACI|nr:MFS transporter [Bacillus pakistanensis]MBM7583697.1 MFS family permease [Bacillus pakistanensis]
MNKQLWILLIGRILTNFADSLYMIATVWYVKILTDSAFLVGMTSAIAILPVTVQFLYGPIIDRFSKRKILYTAMFGQAFFVGIISIMYFNELLWLPLLFVLMFLALSFSEATYPTESALIEHLASREKLTKVNSLFAFSYQTLDIICDAISGILIIFVGLGVIYLSTSFLLLFAGLMFFFYLKVPKSKKEVEAGTSSYFEQYKKDFVQGFQMVRKQKLLLQILFGVMAINVMATMGLAMLPVISSNSTEYGSWLTSISVGTLIGTLISSKLEKFPLNRVMPSVSLFSGLFWFLSIAFIDRLFIPYVFFSLAWLGIGILGIYIQTLIQVNLPKEYLGIGFAFLSSLLGSLSPIGYFTGGLLGEITSEIVVLLLASTGYIGFAIYFFLHPKLKNQLNTSFGHD